MIFTSATNPLIEISQVGQARRAAISMAESLDFSEEQAGLVALVVTEVASNLVKHASRTGELFINRIEKNGHEAIEILAIDRGPGISNLAHSMVDGVSTTNTKGFGLGGIRRMSNEFDIYSVPGSGTALIARIWSDHKLRSFQESTEVGAISVPVPGETLNGDGWAYESEPGRSTVMVVDGLGHGPFAHEASAEAIKIFRQFYQQPLIEILERAHDSLKKTRGAALAVSRIEFGRGLIHFAGIGNIAGAVVNSHQNRRLASMNGIIGFEFRSPKEFSYPFDPGSALIMCSDGLSTKWDLDRYAGILRKDPSLIASVLYRDFKRGKDDCTVVVLREKRTIQ